MSHATPGAAHTFQFITVITDILARREPRTDIDKFILGIARPIDTQQVADDGTTGKQVGMLVVDGEAIE